MEVRNNPFKVPEGYFDDLQKRMEIEAKRKHVSVSRVLKYVASISLVLTLSASVFVIGFSGEKKESLLSSNLFSIFTNKDTVEKKDVKSKSVEEVEEVWEKQLNNLIAEAEAVQFTEAELEYLENFIDEDVNEYVYNNLEILE